MASQQWCRCVLGSQPELMLHLLHLESSHVAAWLSDGGCYSCCQAGPPHPSVKSHQLCNCRAEQQHWLHMNRACRIAVCRRAPWKAAQRVRAMHSWTAASIVSCICYSRSWASAWTQQPCPAQGRQLESPDPFRPVRLQVELQPCCTSTVQPPAPALPHRPPHLMPAWLSWGRGDGMCCRPQMGSLQMAVQLMPLLGHCCQAMIASVPISWQQPGAWWQSPPRPPRHLCQGLLSKGHRRRQELHQSSSYLMHSRKLRSALRHQKQGLRRKGLAQLGEGSQRSSCLMLSRGFSSAQQPRRSRCRAVACRPASSRAWNLTHQHCWQAQVGTSGMREVCRLSSSQRQAGAQLVLM